MSRDTNTTRQKRVASGKCTGGCGKRVANRGRCEACRTKLKEEAKARRKDRVQAGLCPRCGIEQAIEGSRCLKCGLSKEAYDDLSKKGDVVTANVKHPTFMRKLARGRSRLTR